MLVALVAHHSVGLQLDIAVVGQAIKAQFGDTVEVAQLVVDLQHTTLPADDNERMIAITKQVDVVIFFERIVDHPRLWAARHRILIPNPEWLLQQAVDACARLTEMWHKTKASLATLPEFFPNLRHSYIGFSSPDVFGTHPDFNGFIHFRGASTQKQTEVILAAWRRHPDWPELRVHSYSRDPAFLSFPDWLQWRNIRLMYSRLSRDQYLSEFAQAGVHLCPSSVEGFGHSINEARSIGALIVTTDAPPMNELIDASCGVLITPVRTEQQNFGTRHIIDGAGFEKAMQAVLEMPLERRKELGADARRRYLADRERFRFLLADQFHRLARLDA
jgi:hypothetical protein